MPKKRKIDRRRDKSGRIIHDRGIDRGTPELAAKRADWLGRRAHPMERLSHENPVDVLAAHGWLTSEQVDAARAYQHHHTVAFGPLSAQAQAIGTIKGRGITARRRILIQRELAAWNAILERCGAWQSQVFRAYVVDGQIDDTIRAVVRAGATREVDGAYRMRCVSLRAVLQELVCAPPVRVHPDEVAVAEWEEGR